MDQKKLLSNFSFGRVDAETDEKLVNCFIGTDFLKYALQPQHTLFLGGKGSGKSALFRILTQEADRLNQLINFSFNEIIRVPAYGFNSDEFLTYNEIKELNPQTIEDFKYFWQLYFSLKVSYYILNSKNIRIIIKKSSSNSIKSNFQFLSQILQDIGLLKSIENTNVKFVNKLKDLIVFKRYNKLSNHISEATKKLPNVNIILDTIDKILKETNSCVWILVDQIDLLYLDDINKRNKAITALIQLIIEYSNRLTNINLKIFLRTDIYKELNIVNKSHLVTNCIELIWNEDLIKRLILARAVYDRNVKQYCEEKLKENIDVHKIISAHNELLTKVFYAIFQNSSTNNSKLFEWMVSKLTDGLGKIYPREFIHLANQAVSIQREIEKYSTQDNNYLISEKAVKKAFKSVSKYRCETYLYAEYPYLSKHFNKLREYGKDILSKDEILRLFEDYQPEGVEAIRALYETGVLKPHYNKNIENADKYTIPDLYKNGLGITKRKNNNEKTAK